MQYLSNNRIGLTYQELVPKVMTIETYKKSRQRQNIVVHGLGGNGRQVLIEYDSLPEKYKKAVEAVYGDPRQYMAVQPIRGLVKVDAAARKFYSEQYEVPGYGPLPIEYQLKYARQCDWLNVITFVQNNRRELRDTLRITMEQFWESLTELAKHDDQRHDLPSSVDRMRRKYNAYKDGGYAALVEAWRFGNDYARKVTTKIENLILSLAAQPHKPYINEVCEEYRQFMNGTKRVVDMITGEVFDPGEFYSKGEPYILAKSTVDYYLKKPGNLALLDKGRMNGLQYATTHRPTVSRHAPLYCFSKVTMDDIDVPFKGPDGDRVVKSYQIFDSASGAVVGVSFGKEKGVELIREALRDMFRLIIRMGWGVPWEIEFERHLTSAMTGGVDENGEVYQDILTPGAVFPATRMCVGGRANQKRAESLIRVKKYKHQKLREGFQGRFYARLLTNRLNSDLKDMRQAYEQIVANELADINAHNNEPHPDQKRYPGLTRWQVLLQHQNPNLPVFQAHTVMQYIGLATETSIKAGKCQVQYNEYMLPDMLLITKRHYNGKIIAYWMPDEQGDVNSVYLFEDGRFLCEAMKKERFNESILEQTEADKALMRLHMGQQSQFDRIVKEGRSALKHVATLPAADAIGQENTHKTDPVLIQNDGYQGGYYPEIDNKTDVEDAKSRAYRDL